MMIFFSLFHQHTVAFKAVSELGETEQMYSGDFLSGLTVSFGSHSHNAWLMRLEEHRAGKLDKVLLKHCLFLLTFSALASVDQSLPRETVALSDCPSGGILCIAYKRETKPPNQLLGGETVRRDLSRCQERQCMAVSTRPGGAVTPRLNIESEAWTVAWS